MGGGTDTNRTRRKCIQLSDTMGEFLISFVKSCTADVAPPSRHQCQVCVRLICPKKKAFEKIKIRKKNQNQRNTSIEHH